MPETNEWVDEDTHLDTSYGPKPIIEVEESQPPVVIEEVIDDPTTQAFDELETPKPEVNEPTVYDYGDGSSAVIEKDNKGWKATLDAGTGGQPEVFRGHTKDEMYQNLMAGKINATKKIREQNRKIKLSSGQPVQEEPTQSVARKFNADDVTQLKIELQDDPDVALDNWFKKKTGKSIEQVTQQAASGESARMQLHREEVGRAFAQAHPNYYSVHDNYVALMSWLTKYKIGKQLRPDDVDDEGNITKRGNESELLDVLVARGFYTVDTLSEAFEDLKEDGLLVFPAPATVEKPTARVAEEPEVITPTVIRRPRGSLGIRTKETSTMPVRTEQVLNKDITYAELDKLTTKEIDDLMRGIQDLNRDNPALVKEALQRGREKQPR